MDAERGHAHGRSWREDIGAVLQGFLWGEAGITAGEAKREAVGFVADGCEIRQLLESSQRCVRGERLELHTQSGHHIGIVEEVKMGDSEGFGG